MYIHRHAEEVVAGLAEMFGAVLVAGSRQVGKTTMLQNITQNIPERDVGYVTLDDPRYLASAVEQSNTFFKDNPPPVFIDEVQKAPELFPQIKLLIDRERKKGQFYLCGSQQFRMMKNVSESLAGRPGCLPDQMEYARCPEKWSDGRSFLRKICCIRDPEKLL